MQNELWCTFGTAGGAVRSGCDSFRSSMEQFMAKNYVFVHLDWNSISFSSVKPKRRRPVQAQRQPITSHHPAVNQRPFLQFVPPPVPWLVLTCIMTTRQSDLLVCLRCGHACKSVLRRLRWAPPTLTGAKRTLFSYKTLIFIRRETPDVSVIVRLQSETRETEKIWVSSVIID